jgi:uncharacterized protein (TIGR02271 family)
MQSQGTETGGMLMGTQLFPYSSQESRVAETDQEECHIIDYKVVSDRGEDIGKVKDYVFDESGCLRYLIIDVGFWIFGKQVLLPVGMAQIDERQRQVIMSGITKDQVNELPAYHGMEDLSPDYERSVMTKLYPDQQREFSGERLDYDRHAAFKTPQHLQLIEERLQVNKHREMEGQATLRKRVETETETIEVPVTHERLVVERKPVSEGTEAQGVERDIQDETITIPLYAEEIEVTKRPVVSEEVNIRKEQETETRTIREEVRREKLDIDDPTQRRQPKDKI